jgi:hypothetical protein
MKLALVLAIVCHRHSLVRSMSCALDAYRAQPGLHVAGKRCPDLQWAGDRNQELRLRFVLVSGTRPSRNSRSVKPAVLGRGRRQRRAGLPRDVRLRRMSNQQMQPLLGWAWS